MSTIGLDKYQDEVYRQLIEERAAEMNAEQGARLGTLEAEVLRLTRLLEDHNVNPEPEPERYTVRDLIKDLLDQDQDAEVDLEGCDCTGTCVGVEKDAPGWVLLRRH